MASGLPDYQRVIRPSYGAAKRTAFAAVVTASSTTVLGTMTGKGILYGGHLFSVGTDTQKNDVPRITLDGVLLSLTSFTDLDSLNLDVNDSAAFYKRLYDDTNHVYCVAISHGLTFESMMKLEYVESHGRTPVVKGHIIYAFV